jgi:hypothetical protein
MADGLTTTTTVSTIPDGTAIATDDAGAAGHVQMVKLAIATDGSATALPGDANGLLVKGGGTAGTAATAVTTIQGIASMTPIQVGDNSSSLTIDAPVASPAFVRLSDGSAAITTLPVSLATVPSHAVTNAGTFAVQVDGSALTALQLLDDVVATAGTTTYTEASTKATVVGAVRRDANTTLVDTTNEIAPLQVDASGSLKVAIISGAGSGGTAMTDDAAFTPGTTSVTPIGAMFDDASPDSVNEGDGGVVRMSANRNLYQTIRDAAGNERGANVDASGQLAVAGPVTNAGTFAVQVNGDALTALQLIDNIVKLEDDVAGSGFAGVPFLAVRQDSQSDLAADGDFIAPTIDADGGLRVSIVAGAGSGGTALADDADFTDGTTSGTPVGGVAESASPTAVTEGDFGWAAITLNRAFKESPYTPAGQSMADDTADALKVILVDAAGAALTADTQGRQDTALGTITDVTGAMAFARASAAAPAAVSADDDGVLPWALRNGSLVVNVATGSTLVTGAVSGAIDVNDKSALVDDAAFTPATSRVTMVGFEADESGTDSVDEGDGGAARMTLDRKQIVTPQPHTSGGLSTFMASASDGSSILVATAQVIKASAGQLYGYYLYNPESAVTFVHFYNTAAASVTVGTTAPLFTLAIPPASAANLMFTHGVAFSNAGWSCAATTTAGGNTAPATGVSAVIWYV